MNRHELVLFLKVYHSSINATQDAIYIYATESSWNSMVWMKCGSGNGTVAYILFIPMSLMLRIYGFHFWNIGQLENYEITFGPS